MDNNIHSLHHAQLWIGQPEKLESFIVLHLHHMICKHQDATCRILTSIMNKQHHSVTWIRPSKNAFVKDDLIPLFEKIRFSLQQGELHFFILCSATTLSESCANSILKVLEEPPRGYHFFLLSHSIQEVLPTIASRCIKRLFSNSINGNQTAFTRLFCQPQLQDIHTFTQTYASAGPPEAQTSAILNDILKHWYVSHKSATQKNNITQRITAQRIIAAIQHSSRHLPLPGSGKLFWRNLYATLVAIQSNQLN